MYSNRTYIIYGAVLLISLLYIVKLLQIQVYDDKYAEIAGRISMRKQTIYPQRGLIFDRNHKLVVHNDPVRDLMVSVPLRIEGIDTSLICSILERSVS